MAKGEITLLNFNNITYNGSATLACGPTGVIQIKPEFCIGDNGDTSRQPDLSFNLNYVSGKWSGGTMNNWICNETLSAVTEINFRDSSFPRTKPTNVTFTEGTNGEHLANGVTWFDDAADTKYTTHVEQLGVGTGSTIYESSIYDTYFTNTNNTHMFFEVDGCTSLYFCGTESFKTLKNADTCTIRNSYADAFLISINAEFSYSTPIMQLKNKNNTSGANICITPFAGCVIMDFCGTSKLSTINTGICVIGTVSSSSDSRIKDVVGKIDNPLDIVNKLCAVKYTNKLNNDNCIHLGYIAQDIVNVLPEVVSSGKFDKDSKLGKKYTSLGIENEVFGINYDGIIPVLSEGIKIQQICINNLEKRLSILENK